MTSIPASRILSSFNSHNFSLCSRTLHTGACTSIRQRTSISSYQVKRALNTAQKLRETQSPANNMAKGSKTIDYSKSQKQVAIPRPSSSVILVSPTNQILLLHRVQKSSSFASAHVFPGGNISAYHEGEVPDERSPARHEDSQAYRLAAVRETFEESGILLARNNGFGRLIEVQDEEREQGRKEVHANKIQFQKWLAGKGGRADVDGLIPFTRWVTPPNNPRRFTTQMYIYFLPLAPSASSPLPSSEDIDSAAPNIESLSREVVIPNPTHDGGLEHTAARFLHAATWLRMAQSGEIILFPPQFLLLHLVSTFLAMTPEDGTAAPYSREELKAQRKALQAFVKEGDPPWGEKCISPIMLMRRKEDGRAVLGLDKPGPELKGSGRRGEQERVVLVDFHKDGPRKVEVRWKTEVLEEEREGVREGKL